MKKKISHSSLVLVRNCMKQYEYNYVQLRRSRYIPASLDFGTLWDKALTAWHWGKSESDRLLRAHAVIAGSKNDLHRATAKAMIVGYTAMWGSHDIRTVSTQLEFNAPIVNPETGEEHPEYEFIGILDGVVELDGRLLGFESKTSSEDIEPGSPYWQRVTTLDPQVSMYIPGAKAAGYPIEGVLYDVARKPGLRQGKTETAEQFGERFARDIQARPQYYFRRQEVVRLESEARRFAQDLWDYACILSEAERLQRWPRNPDRCRQYGRPCEYLSTCIGESSIDDDTIYETKKKNKAA